MLRDDDPHWPALAGLLDSAIARVSLSGYLTLTEPEAALLRACRFDPVFGVPWALPPIPALVLRHHPALAASQAAWLEVRASAARVPAPPPVTPAAPASAPTPTAPPAPHPAAVRWWWRFHASPDARRLLASLAGRPEPRTQKRALQQRLHRLPAVRLNAALRLLTARGLLTRDGAWIVLAPAIRAALVEAGLRVNPARRDRTLTGAAHGPTRTRAPREPERQKAGRERAERAAAHDPRERRPAPRAPRRYQRRPVPPSGTSAWGRSLLGRKGGLASQRRARAFGHNPTAAATAARIAQAQARRQATAAHQPTHAASPRGPRSHAHTGHPDAPAPHTAAIGPPPRPQAGGNRGALREAWTALRPLGRDRHR